MAAQFTNTPLHKSLHNVNNESQQTWRTVAVAPLRSASLHLEGVPLASSVWLTEIRDLTVVPYKTYACH